MDLGLAFLGYLFLDGLFLCLAAEHEITFDVSFNAIYIYLLLVQNGMDLGPILQFSYAFDPLRYRYVSTNCYIYVRVSTSSMHRDQACMKCMQAKVSHIHNVKTILIVYMFSMSITHQ